MYLQADKIEIDSDEMGFELRIEGDFGPLEPLVINIQNIDLDAFYDQVKGRIGPYLRERDEARASMPAVFACDPDESAGAYEASSPKHPDFHSVHADIWDLREGK